MVLSEENALLEIQIDGGPILLESVLQLDAADVDVGLQGGLRTVGERPLVAAQQVSALDVLAPVGQVDALRQPEVGEIPAVAGRAGIHLAAEHQPMIITHAPVTAKADAPGLPVVVAGMTLGGDRLVAFESLSPDAEMTAAGLAAVAESQQSAFFVAGRGNQQVALGVACAAGDDVDHAIDRVGAPHRGPRAAHHLDAVDVFEQRILVFPEHAGKERRIDAAPVHQHQQLVAEAVVETAHADRPAVIGEAGDADSRRQAQDFGEVGRARAFDVVASDDEHGRGDIMQALGLARGARHLDAEQVFEADVGGGDGVFGCASADGAGQSDAQGQVADRCSEHCFHSYSFYRFTERCGQDCIGNGRLHANALRLHC
ncbi:MAG: hypothetical protein AW09_004690 [Candidatus Accumulibacter phosphatis]|uniref:Uncharacterized protein n=1 Tax=Candidatus Accumulibacter phosphatis TaxID=327160 RepID=A0A084Y678_9PROT|nr:MAG: hypothetical protein AW09_004690 [Candidatus Accumulibacter phosphatis]